LRSVISLITISFSIIVFHAINRLRVDKDYWVL
jgi:hypothetical protein